MTKRIVALLVCVQLLVVMAQPIRANEGISIYLNNELVNYSSYYGLPFFDDNNRTQVPLRLTLEEFGAIVSWDYESQSAIVKKDGVTVRVPIGETFIYKNDEVIINDTESIAVDGRIYVPIRAVMEAFGCDVIWIGASKSVYIDYDEGESLDSIPITYDLRDFGRVTGIKDQGDVGACWAFAAVGAIESSLSGYGFFDFSEDHVSRGHGYNLAPNDGGDIHVAMSYFASWKGPVLETDDPYGDNLFNQEAQVVNHVQEIQLLPKKDHIAIKLAVMAYGAVESYIYFEELLLEGETPFYDSETHSYYYSGVNQPNHDILIIGWDDTYSKENFAIEPLYDGAYICKNSYGEGFGDSGYFYVSYEDTGIGNISVAYTRIEPADNYDNIYQYDDLGWVGTVGYGEETAYFANVYTSAVDNELLRAVSFYTTGQDSQYEVYLATDTKALTDKVLIKRGKLTNKGYYTIDFEGSIPVSGEYVVMVKLTTPGASRPVAVEINKDLPWLGEVVIDDGFGLISPDGINWSRTELLVESNVCLKAFTDNPVDIEPDTQQVPEGRPTGVPSIFD